MAASVVRGVSRDSDDDGDGCGWRAYVRDTLYWWPFVAPSVFCRALLFRLAGCGHGHVKQDGSLVVVINSLQHSVSPGPYGVWAERHVCGPHSHAIWSWMVGDCFIICSLGAGGSVSRECLSQGGIHSDEEAHVGACYTYVPLFFGCGSFGTK